MTSSRFVKKTEDILHPHFDVNDYDFLGVGSGIRVHLPYNEILNVLRRFRLGFEPRIAQAYRDSPSTETVKAMVPSAVTGQSPTLPVAGITTSA